MSVGVKVALTKPCGNTMSSCPSCWTQSFLFKACSEQTLEAKIQAEVYWHIKRFTPRSAKLESLLFNKVSFLSKTWMPGNQVPRQDGRKGQADSAHNFWHRFLNSALILTVFVPLAKLAGRFLSWLHYFKHLRWRTSHLLNKSHVIQTAIHRLCSLILSRTFFVMFVKSTCFSAESMISEVRCSKNS